MPLPRRDLQKLLDQELSIIETLEDLQFGVVKKEEELAKVQAERKQVETELTSFEAKFEAEKSALRAHRDLIRKRLRAIRQTVRMKTLYLLFASDDFAEYLRRERLLGTLLDDDRERLRVYRDAIAHFRASQEELTSRRTRLENVERSILEQKAQIEADRLDRTSLLEKVEKDRQFYEKYHREMRRRSDMVARKIGELSGWKGLGWFEAKKGKLSPPVNYSLVTVPYGYQVHAKFGTKVLQRGITYRPGRVPEGTYQVPVYAIYMGKVIYAGWLSGYGNTIILDHTKGYFTLYSRLSKITVKEGEVLQSRERLGFIGDGNPREAELYFELRVDGKPEDPQPWMR